MEAVQLLGFSELALGLACWSGSLASARLRREREWGAEKGIEDPEFFHHHQLILLYFCFKG